MSLLLGFIRAFIFLYDSMLYATLQTGIISNDAAVMLISDLLILVFIIYSIFFLFRKTPPAIRWFLIVVLFPMVLYFPVIDMYRHSFSSMIWRYHTIIITGIILIAANLFYYKIKEGKLLFTGFQLLLVSLGISSMVFISKEPCIMTRWDCAENWSDAILFSEARNPLLITDFNLGANNLLCYIKRLLFTGY